MSKPATLRLRRQAIDLGIVVSDSAKALAFYRDLLGLTHEGDIPMPIGGGGVMHRLRCGETLIKLVCFDDAPNTKPASGGIPGGTGYRYFSIHLDNLEEVMAALEAAGVPIEVPTTTVREGVTIAMVNDPDGNIVEFLSYA